MLFGGVALDTLLRSRVNVNWRARQNQTRKSRSKTLLSMFSFPKSAGKTGASWGQRLKHGLARTRALLNTDISDLFSGGNIDEAVYEQLETTLLAADVGAAGNAFSIDPLRDHARR